MRRFQKMTIALHAQTFFPHDVFTSDDSLREFPRQDEVTLCQQRITFCRSEIRRVRVAMGRHEQLPSWAATSDSAPNLPRALRRRRKSANLDGDVLLSVWTEDKTSAPWSTAAAEGSCIGRLRNARKRPQPPIRRIKPSPASLLRKCQDSPRVVPKHSSYFHLAAPAQLAIPLFHVSA